MVDPVVVAGEHLELLVVVTYHQLVLLRDSLVVTLMTLTHLLVVVELAEKVGHQAQAKQVLEVLESQILY
tara:strand:- start:128 stop:337 length:210 start_codon:yes stop_codon:yes gene_type:complete